MSPTARKNILTRPRMSSTFGAVGGIAFAIPDKDGQLLPSYKAQASNGNATHSAHEKEKNHGADNHKPTSSGRQKACR